MRAGDRYTATWIGENEYKILVRSRIAVQSATKELDASVNARLMV